MATYHIRNYGSLASPNLRADLDGFIYTTADGVLGGRWDTGAGGEDMSAEDAEEIARINRAATEESERAVARWRADDSESVPLCRDCVAKIGGATGEPAFLWCLAADGEPCGAADHGEDW